MAFNRNISEFYPWTVKGELAGESYSFTAHFRFLPQSRIDEISEILQRQEMQASARRSDFEEETETENINPRTIAAEVMCGWEEMLEDNEPIPFTKAELLKTLEIQGMALAIVKAWVESIKGRKAKNSGRSRGIG